MTASAKATRLLADCRVHPAGAAAVYLVDGDSGIQRRVILGDAFTVCDCPALRERCTHVEAARLLHHALAAERVARHDARAAAWRHARHAAAAGEVAST